MMRKSIHLSKFQGHIIKFGFSLGLLLISFLTLAQSKAELLEQKEVLIQQIKLIEVELNKTQKGKSSIINEVAILNSKIKAQQKLINNSASQIKLSQKKKKEIEKEKKEIKERREKVVTEYTKILTAAYKWKKVDSKWLYILSSSNLNNAFRRYVYFTQFDKKRKANYSRLVKINAQLDETEKKIEQQIILENNLLAEQEQEIVKLNESKSLKDDLLKIAQSQEAELKDKLDEQKNRKKELDNKIKSIIEAEIAKSKKSQNKTFTDRSEESKLNKEFFNNKGRLPWPVSSGYISRKFGKQPHPTIPSLTIENNGVEIATEDGSIVKAIFDGEVIGVVSVPGYQEMIIIKHGRYYTVYSRLEDVLVVKGDRVKAGSALGYVFSDGPQTLMHLEIWKEKVKLDPSIWIKK